MLTSRNVLTCCFLVVSGLMLFGLSPATGAATSPPIPYDPVVRGPLLGEPAHAELREEIVDRTGFPANPAFLIPGTLYDSSDMEVPLQAHPSLPDASRPAAPLVADTYLFVGESGASLRIFDSTGALDDVPPASPSIASLSTVTYPSGGCSRNEPHEYRESVLIEFGSISDDATPSTRVTLAIYAGHSAEEAQTASAPLLVALEDSPWFEYEITSTGYSFFAVEAIDLAGNVSVRSPSVEYTPDE